MKKYPVFKTLKRCINEVWQRDKALFVLFFIYTIIAALYPLASVILPRYLIIELQMLEIDFERILLLVTAFTLFTGLLGFFDRYISDTTRVRIMLVRIELLTNIFDKTNRLDYQYTEDPNFLNDHEDSFRPINGNEGFEGMINRLFKLGSRILLSLLYIYIITLLSYWIVIAIIISIIVSVFNAIIIKKVRYRYKDKLAKATRKIRYYERTTQDFSFGKDIRLFGFQDRVDKGYLREIKSYISVFKRIKNKEYGLAIIDILFVLISDAVLFYILITQIINGLGIAEFSMFLLASLALSTLLKEIGNDITYIIGEGQYMNDYYYFIDHDFNEATDGVKAVDTHTLEVEFRNVSFKYPKTDKWIIRNLNLKINSGEKLAIVGINGAGKTTLVKLLLRFFNPTEGVILVNGRDIREYDKEEYQKMFSPVFQEINILAFTIRENITLGLSDDEAYIWECLDAVGLGDKVRKLENGLDTVMLKNIDENGIILSGGENQKLAIARALYKNGKMIVLDEPTAALDALAEAEIYQNLNTLVEDKTAIYISHRLASTKFCDKIALFKDSSLCEYGDHKQLMKLKGEYYHMFVVQGKYYQEGGNNENLQSS